MSHQLPLLNQTSPCDGCHAGCCRAFAVPITGADILRIERDLQLTFWQFGCRWTDPEGKIARRHAPHFFFSDEPGMPFVICLQHEESRIFNGSTRCRFLEEGPPSEEHPLGKSRCGIYDSRPFSCRAFPTKFNATGELGLVHAVPERGRSEDSPAYLLCPRPWQPEDIDPLTALQTLAVAKYEMEFFHTIAAIWNRSPRAFEIFPEFLRIVYANRVIREEDLVEQVATIPFPNVQTSTVRRAA